MNKSLERKAQIRNSITERYIDTGKSSSVDDIAADLGISASTVRRYIREDYGAIDGTYVAPSYGREPTCYRPHIDHLAEIIRTLRSHSHTESI